MIEIIVSPPGPLPTNGADLDTLIVGEKEAEANEVSVRSRFTGEEGKMSFETFLTRVREEINTRKLMLRQKSS